MRRRVIYCFFVMFAMTSLALIATSCGDEPDEPFNPPTTETPDNPGTGDEEGNNNGGSEEDGSEDGESMQISVEVIGLNGYAANGDILEVWSFNIYPQNSSPGIYITEVKYYFDDNLIATSTTPPFAMSYVVENQTVGKHIFKAVAEVKGEGYADTTYTYDREILILEEPYSLIFDVIYDNDAHPDEVRNGETFSGRIEVNENSTVIPTISSMIFFWDNKQIATLTAPPYEFSYSIQDEAIGEHTFRFVARVYDDIAGYVTHINDYTVQVVE